MGAPAAVAVDLDARDRLERDAMQDMFAAAPPALVRALGVRARREGEMLAMRADGVPARVLNRAMGLGPSAPDVARQLRGLRRFFEGRPHIAALLPSAEPDAEDALAAAGYRPGYAWHVFIRDAATAAGPAALEVRVEVPGEGALEAGDLVCAGFGLPPAMAAWVAALAGRPGWALVTTRDAGTALGAGAVRLTEKGAWLGLGATHPDRRGRGAQGARFAALIAMARRNGCPLVTTETGAPREEGPGPSYRDILRAGFSVAGRRANWRSP